MKTRCLPTLMLCLLMSILELAQTPTSSSADISVSVVVTTTGDRAVTGLALEDFRVFENDVEQTVAYFARV